MHLAAIQSVFQTTTRVKTTRDKHRCVGVRGLSRCQARAGQSSRFPPAALRFGNNDKVLYYLTTGRAGLCLAVEARGGVFVVAVGYFFAAVGAKG